MNSSLATTASFYPDQPAGQSLRKSLATSRILFLLPPTGTYCREDRCQSFFDPALIPTMRVPLEETEAAGAVRSAGGQAAIIDAPAAGLTFDEVCRAVADFCPDLIVLSVTFGSLIDDLHCAQKLKTVIPKLVIGLRGAPCYVWHAEILSEVSYVDFIVRGDYEIVFDELVRKGFLHARGISWRKPSGEIVTSSPPYAESLDTLPSPDYSIIDPALYPVRFLKSPQATIRVQRGCPFTCTYCLVHSVSGNVARHRTPESIVREMRRLIDSGITFFYLRAETFSLKREWAIAVARAIKAHCPEARWVTTTRIECVDAELLKELRAGGCYGMSFGVDVVSSSIGERVKKPVSLARAQRAMRLCDNAGIISLAYIMIGFVWDTVETLNEAQYFAKQLKPDLLTVHYAYPYPGTLYHRAVKEEGGVVDSFKSQSEPALSSPSLCAAVIKGYGQKLLTQHYLRPRVWYSLAKKITTLFIQGRLSS